MHIAATRPMYELLLQDRIHHPYTSSATTGCMQAGEILRNKFMPMAGAWLGYGEPGCCVGGARGPLTPMLKQCTAGGVGDAEMNRGMFCSVFFTRGCHFGSCGSASSVPVGLVLPTRYGVPDHNGRFSLGDAVRGDR
jgi:hypothetical protein